MRERELPAPRRETQHAALATPILHVQTKLAIGRADDPAEVEADRLADQVMRLLDQGAVMAPDAPAGGQLSRVRRAPSAAGDRLGGTEATADAESRIRSRRGRGQPLDEATLTAFGSAFGADFSGVRVHTDDEADQLSRAVEARAFTVGTDIFFRSDTRGSARRPNALLAHELTHVVQQDGAAAAGGLARAVVRRAKAPADLPAAQQAKAVADKAQADARKQLLGYLDDGAKSSDRRLRNSCEMVLQGKVKLYALTMTGDSAARVTGRGDDPADNAAWFPTGLGGAAGDIKSAAVSYNEADLDDDTNIEFDDLVTAGWNINGSVAICDVAAKTKTNVFEVLRHELQHATDHSDDKKAAAGDDGKFKLERYKTEYRAYNYEGSDNDDYSPTKKVQAEGFTWTERQRHIFEHIRDGYAHTEQGWNDNPVINGKSFREHVVAYVNPDDEGFNKYNSPKVEEVYQAVKACASGERNIKAPTVQEVIKKIKLLPREDAIAMSKENPDWTKLITDKFGVIVRNQILNIIQQRAH